MSEKIEPALTAFQWGSVKNENGVWSVSDSDALDAESGWRVRILAERAAEYIALSNAALPDDDPRKITREKIEILRAALSNLDRHDEHDVAETAIAGPFLDALESYLAPEGT